MMVSSQLLQISQILTACTTRTCDTNADHYIQNLTYKNAQPAAQPDPHTSLPTND